MLARFAKNYIARHRHLANQVLHLIGVSLSCVVSIVLLTWRCPWWALAAFLLGYLLQFLGHAIEGNDAGEVVLIKKCLKRPYKEFAPDSQRPPAETS